MNSVGVMSGPRSKVVPIKPGSGGSGKGKDGVAMESMAAPLLRLQDRCRPLLQQFVQALFDQADDALFELADRAINNAEQNMYFESMREVRIKRRGIEQAVTRDLTENFRCLALGISPAEVTDNAVDEVSASNLSLVDHDELEEIVAVDGMIAKAEKEFAETLALFTARIDAMLPHPVTIKTNPFGPACLCQSFLDATRSLDLDIKAKLVLFKLYDRNVVKSLDKLYEAGNQLLVEEGVLPRLKRGGASASKSPLSSHGLLGENESEAEHVFSSLQQLLGQVRPDMGYALDQRAGLVAPGYAPALPREALMQLLADIQQQQIAWLARQQAAVMRGVSPQQLDVVQALNRVLQQRLPNQIVSIGQIDDDAINLVSMLFQFVIEDRNLAAPIKGLIARLQIPILKVAMLDKSFFGKGGHPARKLLNEIANASLGWVPADPNTIERDPFYTKIEALVMRIVDEFSDDISIFQNALEDFIAFVEMDRRRASLVEQRTVDAEDGRAKSELARKTVQDVLNQKVAGKRLPGVVVKLLEDGWSNVMFLICLKEGQDSESWRRAVQTVDELLESVSPVDNVSDRAQLLRMLPTLLKNLRSGLNKIGFNPFDLNQLFAELEQIHLLRLKKEASVDLVAPSEIKPSAEGMAEAAALKATAEMAARAAEVQTLNEAQTLDEILNARQPSAQAHMAVESSVVEAAAPAELDIDAAGSTGAIEDLDRELAAHFGEEVVHAAFDNVEQTSPSPTSDLASELSTEEITQADIELLRSREQRAMERIDDLQVGNWVEFQQSGGKVLRCRLAAIIRATGKYIFVNRSGVKVAENHRDGLLKAYQSGELSLLDEGRLFDRALESVIGNLRDMKARPAN